MKIGIISDTHLSDTTGQPLPTWIFDAFKDVEMIIHAGDLESPSVVNELSHIAPVCAVKGNVDSFLPAYPISTAIAVPIGKIIVAHRYEDVLRARTSDAKVLIYGHTHIPEIRTVNNVLIVNPGSPRKPRGENQPSVALLIINGENISAQFKFAPPYAD